MNINNTQFSEGTFENTILNEDLFNQLIVAQPEATYDLYCTVLVQARKHKKKRINKKWRKRYGFKEKQICIPGVKLESCTDGDYVFTL